MQGTPGQEQQMIENGNEMDVAGDVNEDDDDEVLKGLDTGR